MIVFVALCEDKNEPPGVAGIFEDRDDAYACAKNFIEEWISFDEDEDVMNKFRNEYAKDRDEAMWNWVRENVSDQLGASIDSQEVVKKTVEKKLDEAVG